MPPDYSNTQQDYFTFLDALRESGTTNMYASGRLLREGFPELDEAKAREVFFKWTDQFEAEEEA